MLKRMRIHNFRTYLNAEFEFTNYHVVIGANNSGKTNLCVALSFIRSTASQDLNSAAAFVPGGISEIRNWTLKSDVVEFVCNCELPFDGRTLSYTYALSLVLRENTSGRRIGQTDLRVKHESLDVTGPDIEKMVLLSNDGHEAQLRHEESADGYTATTLAPKDATMLSKLYELETNRRAIHFRRYLSSWLYFSLSPKSMRFGWRDAPATATGMSVDGSNLATILYQLKNLDESRYRRVLEHVRLIEPNIEAINFITTPDQSPIPFVDLRTRPRATWVGLSDGTLRCLGLALIAEATCAGAWQKGDVPRQFVIVEEPENGIYPGQLRRFFDVFEERSAEGQLIFTSHSPYFINFFDASRESVMLLRRRNDITEVCRVAPPDEDDPDRLLLADEYAMELLD